eukprot:TRINITY_DN1460_c0_g1_i1.p1 TRINITY_DN1460_c0_g1~~TRINITY_DN1460_c0_g1_i1.p1  ORF type:complete len:321 (+),score=49.13 TRINITY_DN1460_c0_g1_i1:64-1026(+)
MKQSTRKAPVKKAPDMKKPSAAAPAKQQPPLKTSARMANVAAAQVFSHPGMKQVVGPPVKKVPVMKKLSAAAPANQQPPLKASARMANVAASEMFSHPGMKRVGDPRNRQARGAKQHIPGKTDLMDAAEQDAVEKMRVLLADTQTDPAMTDVSGWTALHWAAKGNAADAARLLLTDPRTRPDATERLGLTALHLAAQNATLDAAKVLIADPRTPLNSLDNERCSPLGVALRYGSEPVALAIMENSRGYDLMTDAYGNTFLHYAVRQELSEEIVIRLLAHPKIDVNAKDNDGWSPLDAIEQLGAGRYAAVFKAHLEATGQR